MAPKVPNTNRDWNRKWFFIKPKDPKIDWAFPTAWHETPLISTWKVVNN